MIVQCEAGKSASQVRQGRQGNAKNQPAGSQDAEDGCTRGANNTVVREKEGQRLTVMWSSPHAVAPVLQQRWEHWPTGTMGTTLVSCRTTHGHPLHPLELKIVKEGLGAGYPQPGAGRHAAMCIS
jgi:hypothetical protein